MIDIQKINLKKNAGPIVFLGSMNAMPMMYAIELKSLGYDVLYFVDAKKADTLSRPENHFSEITYPYPAWIIEVDFSTQMLLPFFRFFFSWIINSKVRKLRSNSAQLYILNGFFISLSPCLASSNIPKIALSHGSDLDSWADTEGAELLSNSFYRYSFFRFMPKFLAKKLIKLAVLRQFDGLLSSDLVVFFPRGFSPAGDRVLDKLAENQIPYYERYDISFEPLKTQDRSYKDAAETLVILSAVRFTYKTFSEGNTDCSKGNDEIIKGLARFYREHKNIVVHFVEKGPDVGAAKLLCEKTELGPAVVWHKEMKFIELLDLYAESDICFDQVGHHWIGAVGGYALYLGKPLIANDQLPVSLGLWPKDNPVFSSATADDVYRSLKLLTVDEIRREASEKSKIFAETYMSSSRFIQDVFSVDTLKK